MTVCSVVDAVKGVCRTYSIADVARSGTRVGLCSINRGLGEAKLGIWVEKWAQYTSTTVEPPNKGHFGANSFVPCREVVPISEVK